MLIIRSPLIIAILITYQFERIPASSDCSQDISYICALQENCRDCIRAHQCCNWCYQKDYGESRCFLNSTPTNCKSDYIFANKASGFVIKESKEFAKVFSFNQDNVQMKPQRFDINLRIDEPVNITIYFQPVKDFPLELYFLMDLTVSMQPELSAVAKLGTDLAQTLRDITANYKLAFGSYVDKLKMPFYLTDPISYENPCEILGKTCKKAYLFKHDLNFTSNISEFINKVNASRVSANLDNLEGGMDALMQILVCKNQLGWTENSRKLVLIATDGMMHFASDGILIGVTRRNNEFECLLDENGNVKNPHLYDYPSLEEIKNRLDVTKTNIIFAVKEIQNYYIQMKHMYYDEIHKLIPDRTFVGELRENSENIIKLVRDGYKDFLKRVSLSFAKHQEVEGLEFEFFADCEGIGVFEKTDTCYNAEENKNITFVVQMLLTEYQKRKNDIFVIEDNNLHQKTTLNITYVGNNCLDCKMAKTEQDGFCQNGGQYECNSCVCLEGWSGTQCENACPNDIHKCRSVVDDTTSQTCFGRGHCVCSKCTCDEPFSGVFCEYECPVARLSQRVCGYGTCMNGSCFCNPGFEGEDCTCSKSQDLCTAPGATQMCSGHGNCVCNECKCDSGYNGAFCEHCEYCVGMCNVYADCIEDFVQDKERNQICVFKNFNIPIESIESVEDIKRGQRCFYKYSKNGKECSIHYSYLVQRGNTIKLYAENESCGPFLTAKIGGIIIIGIIIALGILGLIIWKLYTTFKDKHEYQKFERERILNRPSSMQNPIYKSPVVTYRNVLRKENDKSE